MIRTNRIIIVSAPSCAGHIWFAYWTYALVEWTGGRRFRVATYFRSRNQLRLLIVGGTII